MATYGGTQQGNPYLRQNPVTGEVEYVEGDMLEVSPETVMRDWKMAKAWLYQQIRREMSDDD